tara:strand:- start:3407 stop:4054 length:648 start_codon:yes stop_codon:yes gene_type:complete
MPLEDTEGFTEMAMGPQTQNQVPMGSPHQDAHMLAEFYLHPQEDSAKSEELGRPYFVDREYVRITQPGNKNSIIERPIRFGPAPKNDNHRFAHQYNLFKQGEQQVMSGTPLTEWAGVTAAQVKNLKYANIQTVEQLSEVADNQIMGMMGGSGLKQKAKDWLANAEDGKVVVQLRAELKERDNRLAAQEQGMAELLERVNGMEKTPDVKGRRKVAE